MLTTNSYLGAEQGSVKRTATKTRRKPDFPRGRYWALMLVSGGGQFVDAPSPEGAAREIWRHNRWSRHNFDSGDIERNQRTAEQILNGEAEWYRCKDGDYWFNGND